MKFLMMVALVLGAAQTTSAAGADVQKGAASMEGRNLLAPQLGMTSYSIEGSGMSSRGGILAGVEYYIPLSENFKFETGLNFMEMGAKNTWLIISTEIEISTLAVPLIAHYTLSDNQDTGNQWVARGGAVLTQTIGATFKDWDGSSSDMKGDVAANDILLTAGLGWSTKVFDDYRWTVDGSYSRGTVNTLKAQSGKSSGLAFATSLVIPL